MLPSAEQLVAARLKADPKNGLVIACGDGAVRILEVQAPGGKKMRPEDYFRGHPFRQISD